MLTHELLNELHKLNRADKLRVVQLLVNELAAPETDLLQPNVEYPIYTPFGNEGAAQTLYEFLQASKTASPSANPEE
jgi:hypothetical protein